MNQHPPTYHELLRPPAWTWLAAAGFALCVGVAYGYAFDAAAGWLIAGALGAAMAVGLLRWRLAVVVDAAGLHAGRAVLPFWAAGRTMALDAERARQARTTRSDARAHLALRTLAAQTAVLVEVTDLDDPHPYWLVSSRRPAELLESFSAWSAVAEQLPSGRKR